MLSREYEEGILLFEIMDQKIWSYAIEDSAGLVSYYKQNIGKYQWDTRLKAIIFRSRDIQTIDEVRDLLQEPYYYLSEDSVIFKVGSEVMYAAEFQNQLDSLYQKVVRNEDWLIEITPSEENDPQQILSMLKKKNFDLDKFIVIANKSKNNLLKMVSISKKDIDKSISEKSGVNLQIESGIYQKGDDIIIDLIDWHEGIHDLSIEENEYVIFIEKVLPAMNQEFEEVKGKVISDYQNYLDELWIHELREKYDVQINDHALNHIIDRFEKL
jgi:peptidyl-prolyl cis-trans isomerase SurA